MDHLSNFPGMLCTNSVKSTLFKLANIDSNVSYGIGERRDDPGCIIVLNDIQRFQKLGESDILRW